MSPPLFAMTVSVQDSDIGMPRAVVEAGYWRAADVAGSLPLNDSHGGAKCTIKPGNIIGH